MQVEIISSGDPRRTIIRDVDTGEEITNVVTADIHLGLEGCYVNMLVTHPIVKYIGPAYISEDYITIEKSSEEKSSSTTWQPT